MNILRKVSASLLSSDYAVLWWETDSLTKADHGLNVHVFGDTESRFFAATTRSVVKGDGSRSSFHQVEIRNIAPGRSISVSVVGPGFSQSVPTSFYPPATNANLELAVLSSAEGNMSGLTDSIDEAGETVNGVLSCGNMLPVYDCSVDDIMDFMDATDTVVRNVPFIAATSNDSNCRFFDLLKNYPANRRFYLTALGPLQIMCLDTSKAGRRGLGGHQAEWALDVFSSASWKSASYRIILCSSVFRTNMWDSSKSFGNGSGVDAYLENALLPILKQSGASLVICGGAKSYQRGSIESLHQSMRGSSTAYITCCAAAPMHNFVAWDHPADKEPSTFVETAAEHVVKLLVSSSSMRVTCTDKEDSNVLIDALSIPPSTL